MIVLLCTVTISGKNTINTIILNYHKKYVKLIVPNQLNNAELFITPKGVVRLILLQIEFDKNASFVSVEVNYTFPQSWFGDYRSLRFLCVCFGGRIFCFYEV